MASRTLMVVLLSMVGTGAVHSAGLDRALGGIAQRCEYEFTSTTNPATAPVRKDWFTGAILKYDAPCIIREHSVRCSACSCSSAPLRERSGRPADRIAGSAGMSVPAARRDRGPSVRVTSPVGYDAAPYMQTASDRELSAQRAAGSRTTASYDGDANFKATRGGAQVLGRGSTASLSKGTTLARNLREQLAIRQAMANPTAGAKLPLKMTDPRWPASEGWAKMQQVVESGGREGPINVHYLFNEVTKAIDDFKIVLPGRR